MDKLRSVTVLFVSLIAGCATASYYTLLYEQSGGLGGVLEYRISIDSTRQCTVELLDDSHRTVTLRLDERTYRRIGAMIADTAVWSLGATTSDEPQRPDAPQRHLQVRFGEREKTVVLGSPLPDAARSIVAVLDSLAHAATRP